MRVNLKGQKFIRGATARVDEVQREVLKQGKKIEAEATSILEQHRDTGEHHIEGHKRYGKKYGELDYEVALVGPAPMSVEFGHWLVYFGTPTHQYIQGLYILHRAAGLI